LNSLELEISLCIEHAVVDEGLIVDSLFVTVVVRGRAVATIEELKSIVIDIVGWCCGQAQLNGIKVVENCNAGSWSDGFRQL
jgi:hypothetical protein